jgi:hypothetical protein
LPIVIGDSAREYPFAALHLGLTTAFDATRCSFHSTMISA